MKHKIYQNKMTTSFFKQGSNAKIMNNLCYYIRTVDNYVEIKNNKSKNDLYLNEEEEKIIEDIDNDFYRTYYNDILLIKKGLEYVFNQTEEKFHKYINLNIKCSNIYAENALKEWIYIWFNNEREENNNIKYERELKNIYKHFKKCRISIN